MKPFIHFFIGDTEGHNKWLGDCSCSKRRTRFMGYISATLVDNDGDTYNDNAHPCYRDAPWYDWAYVYDEIKEDGECKAMHYPSKILGFLQSGEDVNAVVQCAIDPVPWSKLEEKIIAKFCLCTDVGKEEIVPMSSLIHPVCVVPVMEQRTEIGTYCQRDNGVTTLLDLSTKVETHFKNNKT